MADTPNSSPDKPKKKIITVGNSERSSEGGERRERGERRGGKGRRGGRGREEERKPAVPPALMRGPRPKPKAEVVEEAAPETEAEPTVEGAASEDADATAEGAAES